MEILLIPQVGNSESVAWIWGKWSDSQAQVLWKMPSWYRGLQVFKNISAASSSAMKNSIKSDSIVHSIYIYIDRELTYPTLSHPWKGISSSKVLWEGICYVHWRAYIYIFTIYNIYVQYIYIYDHLSSVRTFPIISTSGLQLSLQFHPFPLRYHHLHNAQGRGESNAMNFVARVEIQKLTTDIFFVCGVMVFGWLKIKCCVYSWTTNIMWNRYSWELFVVFSDVRHGESTERNLGERDSTGSLVYFVEGHCILRCLRSQFSQFFATSPKAIVSFARDLFRGELGYCSLLAVGKCRY